MKKCDIKSNKQKINLHEIFCVKPVICGQNDTGFMYFFGYIF